MDLKDFIGKHECSDFPPSLFEEDGKMRSGTKASLLKVLKEETKVATTPQLPEDDTGCLLWLTQCTEFAAGLFTKVNLLELLLKNIFIFCCMIFE